MRRWLLSAAGPGGELLPGLTARETGIVDLVAAGHANHTIARALGLSRKTAADNLSTIIAKLGVPDRVAVIALAREAGPGG